MRLFCLLLILLLVSIPVALQAQTYTVLHAFTDNPDGAIPASPVVIDGSGNLLGTTSSGGGQMGRVGTVFGVNTNTGVEFHLNPFGGKKGAGPEGSLALDPQGNLYGTNYADGAGNGGVVFKIDSDGHETVLYSFGTQVGEASGVIR